MKRIIVTYLILCLFIPISMEAKKKPFGNGLYWEIYDNGVLVISGNGDIPGFSLSSSGRGKWIKKAPWLSDLPQINKIIIEEGITSIGALSFYYESGRSKDYHLFCPVKEVFLPNSLIRIGYKSFYGCKQLNRINLNDGLKIIGDKAFSFCNLKEIIMPNTVETIGVSCFENNHSLQYVVLSNQITEIPKMAFMDCNKLSSVEFPIGLQTIGDYAFGFWNKTDHGELNSIILPAKMKSIGKMAFCGNRANEISLPDSIKSIGEFAFVKSSVYDANNCGASYDRYQDIPYKGEILSLPSFVNEKNARKFGFDVSVVKTFLAIALARTLFYN